MAGHASLWSKGTYMPRAGSEAAEPDRVMNILERVRMARGETEYQYGKTGPATASNMPVATEGGLRANAPYAIERGGLLNTRPATAVVGVSGFDEAMNWLRRARRGSGLEDVTSQGERLLSATGRMRVEVGRNKHVVFRMQRKAA